MLIQYCGHYMSSSQCLLDRTSYSTVVTVCPARSACSTGPHTAMWSLHVQLVVPVRQDLIQQCGHCMSSSQCLLDRTSYSTVVTVCPARSACQTGPHTALWSLYVQLVVPVRQDLIQHCGHYMSSSQCLLTQITMLTLTWYSTDNNAKSPGMTQITMLILTWCNTDNNANTNLCDTDNNGLTLTQITMLTLTWCDTDNNAD